MLNFLKALKSIKLAVGLLAYIAVAGILATLIPQGREAAFYLGAYPKLLAEILVRSGFTRFFASPLFLVPAMLFFLNLSTCTVDRVIREFRKPRAKRRHGPDILHLGLMLLITGSIVSFSGRIEGSILLAKGEGVELPDGSTMKLTNFEYQQYGDGRPKDWISTVDILHEGMVEVTSFPIRVNHPLKIGSISIYQMSHSTRRVLALGDPSGKERTLVQGDNAAIGGTTVFFMAIDEGSAKALLRVVDSAGVSKVLRASAGELAGPFRVIALRNLDLTGLQAVKDPGYGLVFVALVLAAIGLFLTFIRKIGDMNP